MPIQLLPATAAAFAPRATPNIVLAAKAEPWLTQTLKRINRVKRPLNSVQQHQRCLTETLAGDLAMWNLCSLLLPKAPDSELRKDSNPLIEAMFNYQLLHVEAYVVHVDMVSQYEVAFKLTKDTIDALVDYHRDIYCVDTAAALWSWAEKEVQVKKLQQEFVQAVNRFVFRANARALEGLEEDGAGELLDGRSDDVKNALMTLFQPLLPPPPRIVNVVRPAPMLPSCTQAGNWWQAQQTLALPPPPPPPAPVDSWRVLPSTPSPTMTACSDYPPSSTWAPLEPALSAPAFQLPSPAPSFSQLSQTYCTSADFVNQTYSTAGDFSSPPYMSPAYSSAPLTAFSLPSISFGAPCGVSSGFGDFGPWSYSHFAPQYATTM